MRLHFKKMGEGSPLVVIHGLYGSSDNWYSIGKRLAEQYTVFLVDQRNHGRSPHLLSHTYDDMVDDLKAFADSQHLEKFTLLGHSMGGKTAMWFAANYPEMIEKLVVADIAPRNYLELKNESQFFLHRNILLAMQDIDFENIESRKDIADYLEEKIDNSKVVQFLLKSVEINKENKQYQWRLNAKVLYDYLEEIIDGVNDDWLEDRMPITNYPVIFIRGLESHYIREAEIKVIKKIYPEAKIIDIENAGHWLHAEQPQKFVQAVTTSW